MQFLIFLIVFLSFILIVTLFFIFKLHKKNEQLDSLNEEYIIELTTLRNTLEFHEIQNNNTLKTIMKLEEENKSIKDENKILNNSLSTFQTKLELEVKHAKEKEEKFKDEFKMLANDIFETNTKNLSKQNQESLGNLLNPMSEQIKDFKKKVEDVYEKESTQRNFLQIELKSLKELNLKISNDAVNLTNALKGNSKQQGIWGEMVLYKVLENSGLREGIEYKKEVSLKDQNNKGFRPDVIVSLPSNRDIIIDAKTSLNSYNNYISAEEKDKKIHLKSHILAIKEHIRNLSNKQYETLEGVNSLDFIFMFIPIEGALLLALDNDIHLFDEAFKQKIILVSPTTLLVALKAIENSWRYEKQAKNITEVTKRAELLYNKFYGFVENMKQVSEHIERASHSHKKAYEQLSTGNGNLISQVKQLKTVANINPKKELDDDFIKQAV